MKLASLNDGRDGQLVVVSKDLKKYVPTHPLVSTMQEALDCWCDVAPKLQEIYDELNVNKLALGFRYGIAAFARAVKLYELMSCAILKFSLVVCSTKSPDKASLGTKASE